MKTQMWDLAAIATGRECPDCGAQPTQRCRSLRGNSGDEIAQPHPARYPAGDRNIGSPANAAALREATR